MAPFFSIARWGEGEGDPGGAGATLWGEPGLTGWRSGQGTMLRIVSALPLQQPRASVRYRVGGGSVPRPPGRPGCPLHRRSGLPSEMAPSHDHHLTSRRATHLAVGVALTSLNERVLPQRWVVRAAWASPPPRPSPLQGGGSRGVGCSSNDPT